MYKEDVRNLNCKFFNYDSNDRVLTDISHFSEIIKYCLIQIHNDKYIDLLILYENFEQEALNFLPYIVSDNGLSKYLLLDPDSEYLHIFYKNIPQNKIELFFYSIMGYKFN